MAPENDRIRALDRPDAGLAPAAGTADPGGRHAGELLLMTHPIDDGQGKFVGAMLVARNLGLHEPGALDAQLLAQARRARPADGRRRARGEEPAQRDDDPSRAAEEQSWRGRSRAGCRRRRAPAIAASRPSRRRDLGKHVDIIAQRDPAARPGPQRLPEVRAPRRAEAAAGPPRRRVISDIVTTVTPEAESLRRDGEARLPARPAADQRGPRRCCGRRC